MARQSKYSKRRVPGGKTFRRYPENLQWTKGHGRERKIWSYGTHVATFQSNLLAGRVITKGYWSSTTSKHINYAARKWGVSVVKGKGKK